MENKIRRPQRTGLSILLRGLALVLIGAVLVLIVLRGYVGIVIKRSEKLQQRISTLQPVRSTLADVHTVMPNGTRFSGECTEKECYASVAIGTTELLHGVLDNSLLRFIGIRPAKYQVTVDVRNGVVRRIGFLLLYRSADGTWFSGSTAILDQFSDMDRCQNPSLLRHPTYVLIANQQQPNARIVRSGVTLDASPEEVHRAQTLNLSCATSLHHCSLADLMPFAYRDFEKDSKWEGSNQERTLAKQAACEKALSASATRPVPWWTTGWQSAEN